MNKVTLFNGIYAGNKEKRPLDPSYSSVFLLLGGNQGDRDGILKKARELISERVGAILAASQLYETTPWGFNDQTKFLNQALQVSTLLTPVELLGTLLDIERLLGRVRTSSGYQSRSIDIDILFYGNIMMNEEALIIPHPRIPERRFVLVPLAEIALGFIHPGLGIPIGELLNHCQDTLDVIPYLEGT